MSFGQASIREREKEDSRETPFADTSPLQKAVHDGGDVPVEYVYHDETRSIPIAYSKEVIENNCQAIASSCVGRYRGIDTWLYEALAAYPIKGKNVAIIGSTDQGFGPWYESVCLCCEGHPTTIEYNDITFPDERIRYLKAPLNLNEIQPFDAAISISTFEHSGLGRYGDPIDPDGDLKAISEMKRILKPDGLLYLSVPLGLDKLIFNSHRIYGRIRLPLLLNGWAIIDSFGFEDELLDRDTGYGWEPIKLSGTDKELMHPDYPEYGPIMVLRNDFTNPHKP